MDLSIVIVSYNTRDMLRDCLRSIPVAVAPLICEIFVVDNNSPDDSAGMVASEFPEVKLIANKHNAGFTSANNQALKLSAGRHALILNPDTEARPGSLAALVAFLDAHPEAGAVGPKLLNTDGSLQPSGTPFPSAWTEFVGHSGLFKRSRRFHGPVWSYGREDFDKVWETDSVSGACLMVRGSVMAQVGMLSEDFFMYYEEVEWCWRIKQAGYKVFFVPQAEVVHHWMGSVRQQSKAMTKRLFRSMRIYHRKTAGLGTCAVIAFVATMGTVKNEILHAGVAVKRKLRARGLIK